MTDDVLTSKAATITRCVARAREEYDKDPSTFLLDPSRHDAAILNILRANAAALDMGHHLICREKLGVPQSARVVFELLCRVVRPVVFPSPDQILQFFLLVDIASRISLPIFSITPSASNFQSLSVSPINFSGQKQGIKVHRCA